MSNSSSDNAKSIRLNIRGKTYEFSNQKLSESARATLYSGVCEETHSKVVIKYMDKSDPEQMEYVRRESKRLAKLPCHPNIIKMLEYGHNENSSYLIMERLHKDLFEFLCGKNSRKFNKILGLHNLELKEKVIRSIFKPILEGVNHLHDNNICHLDLKFDNILVTKDMDIVISDFEFASKIKDKNNKSTVKDIVGSENYMCPEMKKSTFINGEKADMYSLGVILFCLAFGSYPFTDDSRDIHMKQYAKFDMWDRFRDKKGITWGKNTSVELWNLIESMLCFHPEERASTWDVQEGSWMTGEVMSKEELKKFFE
jgi:serine/threonine protein kinase